VRKDKMDLKKMVI